jgi:hydroxypyruvate reductase
VADPTSCADALAVVRRYDIALPAAALALLAAGAGESVKPGDARLAGHEVRLVATPRMALQAAALVAEAAGVRPVLLGDRIEGEAREVARVMAGIALSAAAHGEPAAAPCVLLSGGETSVTVRGDGTGGRNVEFLLALAIALRGRAGIYALAADTDGVDGGAEVAGAWIGPETLEHARALGMDPAEALARNDGHGFFAALGQQIITGPTLTNVNDFRAILIV